MSNAYLFYMNSWGNEQWSHVDCPSVYWKESKGQLYRTLGTVRQVSKPLGFHYDLYEMRSRKTSSQRVKEETALKMFYRASEAPNNIRLYHQLHHSHSQEFIKSILKFQNNWKPCKGWTIWDLLPQKIYTGYHHSFFSFSLGTWNYMTFSDREDKAWF